MNKKKVIVYKGDVMSGGKSLGKEEFDKYEKKMKELERQEELKKRKEEARKNMEEDEAANVRGTKIPKGKKKFPNIFGMFGK